jgi:hypothetical protein
MLVNFNFFFLLPKSDLTYSPPRILLFVSSLLGCIHLIDTNNYFLILIWPFCLHWVLNPLREAPFYHCRNLQNLMKIYFCYYIIAYWINLFPLNFLHFLELPVIQYLAKISMELNFQFLFEPLSIFPISNFFYLTLKCQYPSS